MLKNLQKTIRRVGQQYVDKLKTFTPKDTGNLANSIKLVVTDDGFDVDALPYLDFLDKGVNGVKNSVGSIYSYTIKKPPIASLTQWANRRGINVYALQNSIYQNGVQPRRFITKADTEIDINEIVAAYNKDIDTMFDF